MDLKHLAASGLIGGASLLALGWTDSARSQPVALPGEPSAQEGSQGRPASQQTPATDPGVVVVTGRRRSETVQDAPLAVTAITGARLEQTGSFNVERLQQSIPTVQFYSSNPRNTAVNIRGIGAPFGLTNDGIEQGVGIYVDDVYYARVAASTFDFLDVERLEVLRGPQGTLYGKNTTAGAVNITSRPPTFEPEGSIAISAGSLGFGQFRGAVSGPLNDRLAARLVVSASVRDGTLTHVTTGADVNALDNAGIRGQLLWRPDDAWDVTVSADFSRQDANCCTQIYVRVAPTQRASNRQFPALANQFGYVPPSTDPFDRLADNDTPLRAEQEFGGASVRARRETPWGQLTFVSGWRFWDWNPSNDRDFTSLPITTVSANPSSQSQWTHEVRLSASPLAERQYVIGLFLFQQDLASTGLQEQGKAASGWLLGPVQGANPALLDGLRQQTAIDFQNTSGALFGRIAWPLTQQLSLETGLRLNYDSKDADYRAIVAGGLATSDPVLVARKNSILQSQSYLADFEDWNLSGDATLTWKPSPDVLAYATAARAFRSGGVNLSGIPNRPDGTPAVEVATVAPETITHHEAGLKLSWPQARLSGALAVFHTRIDDYQATVVNGATGTLRGYLANAEQVSTQGVELDLRYRPTRQITISSSLAWTDARYDRFPDAPPPVEQSGGTIQVVDISGQRLPGVSEWAATLAVDVVQPEPVGLSGLEAWWGIDASYRSDWSSSASPSAFMMVEAAIVTNLRAGVRKPGGWNIWLWARNVADTETFDYLTAQSGSTGLIVGAPSEPRTWGVSFANSF